MSDLGLNNKALAVAWATPREHASVFPPYMDFDPRPGDLGSESGVFLSASVVGFLAGCALPATPSCISGVEVSLTCQVWYVSHSAPTSALGWPSLRSGAG